MKNRDEILQFIGCEWKKVRDKQDYKINFPKLILSTKWKFDNLIFRKKNNSIMSFNQKIVDKIVDYFVDQILKHSLANTIN